MIQRCTNPRSKDYKIMAVGVLFQEEWLMSFAQFVEDMGDRPAGMTDRIDRNGPYSKETVGGLPFVQNKNKVLIYRSKLEKVLKFSLSCVPVLYNNYFSKVKT